MSPLACRSAASNIIASTFLRIEPQRRVGIGNRATRVFQFESNRSFERFEVSVVGRVDIIDHFLRLGCGIAEQHQARQLDLGIAVGRVEINDGAENAGELLPVPLCLINLR